MRIQTCIQRLAICAIVGGSFLAVGVTPQTPQTVSGEKPDIIVADLEGYDFEDWRTYGAAFGNGPATDVNRILPNSRKLTSGNSPIKSKCYVTGLKSEATKKNADGVCLKLCLTVPKTVLNGVKSNFDGVRANCAGVAV